MPLLRARAALVRARAVFPMLTELVQLMAEVRELVLSKTERMRRKGANARNRAKVKAAVSGQPHPGTSRWRRRFDDPTKRPTMLAQQKARAARWYQNMKLDPEKFARAEARRKRSKAAWRERRKAKRLVAAEGRAPSSDTGL